MDNEVKNVISVMLILVLEFISTSCGIQDEKEFANPILAGTYPDPSICRVDDSFYLINSTFAFFPGIPVFESKDLVNWKLIGHVLDRPEQLDLEGMGVSRGIFAPAISYHEGIFYVTSTLADGGGNFVVTSQNPGGPYINPVWLPEVNGVDPSVFFDDDGKAYLMFNSDAPRNKPQYSGHRTIRMFGFDYENLKVIGEEKILVNGGSDISKKPVWIEGPHIYKRYGNYYLVAAEGGTAEDHSEVIFRSKEILGPYLSYRNNPILTQRNLDPSRNFPITSTGHADLVETPSGDWWAVFLGRRPYRPFENGYVNTGRETFLAPVKWQEDPENKGYFWPVINPGHDEVQYFYDYPIILDDQKHYDIAYSGNFENDYEFDTNELHGNFIFLRTPREKWYDLESRPGYLSIKLRPETVSGTSNPSFIAHRQQHLRGAASTSMQFGTDSGNEKAGLIIFHNEDHYYYLCQSSDRGKPVIQLYKSIENNNSSTDMELMAEENLDPEKYKGTLELKINSEGRYYSFYYSYENEDWIPFKEEVDGVYLREVIPRDFVGCFYGMYATSLNMNSENSAYYDWFRYKGMDDVY